MQQKWEEGGVPERGCGCQAPLRCWISTHFLNGNTFLTEGAPILCSRCKILSSLWTSLGYTSDILCVEIRIWYLHSFESSFCDLPAREHHCIYAKTCYGSFSPIRALAISYAFTRASILSVPSLSLFYCRKHLSCLQLLSRQLACTWIKAQQLFQVMDCGPDWSWSRTTSPFLLLGPAPPSWHCRATFTCGLSRAASFSGPCDGPCFPSFNSALKVVNRGASYHDLGFTVLMNHYNTKCTCRMHEEVRVVCESKIQSAVLHSYLLHCLGMILESSDVLTRRDFLSEGVTWPKVRAWSFFGCELATKLFSCSSSVFVLFWHR